MLYCRYHMTCCHRQTDLSPLGLALKAVFANISKSRRFGAGLIDPARGEPMVVPARFDVTTRDKLIPDLSPSCFASFVSTPSPCFACPHYQCLTGHSFASGMLDFRWSPSRAGPVIRVRTMRRRTMTRSGAWPRKAFPCSQRKRTPICAPRSSPSRRYALRIASSFDTPIRTPCLNSLPINILVYLHRCILYIYMYMPTFVYPYVFIYIHAWMFVR